MDFNIYKVSTTHAMLIVGCHYLHIYENVNDNAFTGQVMVDLTKAFDTVSHSILISKLQNYGIRGVAADSMRLYLRNRQQFVSINQHRSNIKTITCGVPQGSSLGPLFFSFICKRPCKCFKKHSRLFVSDTCLAIKSTNPNILQNKINSELQKLHVWSCVNKLTVNPDKTNILVVSLKLSKPISSISVSSNGTMVNVVDRTKYLGAILDNKRAFQEHIKTLKK